MKRLLKAVIIGLIGVLVLAGCSKAPTQEINDTKAKVEAADTKDMQTYAKDELAKVKSDLDAALAEVKRQDSKFLFKHYGRAKQMLAKVRDEAEALKPMAAKMKEEAKNNAIAAQVEAKAAIEATKASVAKALSSKKAKSAVKTFKKDLTSLEASLTALQQTINQELYADAESTAKVIKEKVAAISNDIKAALGKSKTNTTPKAKSSRQK